MKIIIGIPAFNEEKNIASIITKLRNISDTIVVCNDGSSDLTSEIAERMGAVVINHEKNLGYGGAIRSIFLKAKELDGDVLVTFDADGQHRIEDIENVITPITSKNPLDSCLIFPEFESTFHLSKSLIPISSTIISDSSRFLLNQSIM